jgi:hypothetical protein
MTNDEGSTKLDDEKAAPRFFVIDHFSFIRHSSLIRRDFLDNDGTRRLTNHQHEDRFGHRSRRLSV